MPPRTRRGGPRGGAAAAAPSTARDSAAAAITTPSSDTQPPPAQQPEAQMAPPPVPAPAAAAPAAPATRSFTLKPKVVRRADEERKALAEQEEKKFNDRAAEDARRRRASRGRGRGRGRGGRGRGRGDFGGFGRDGLVRRVEAPDGPLSQGAILLSRGGRAGGSIPGRFGGGGSGAGSGSGSGSSGVRPAGSSGPIFSIGSDVPEHDPRLNTDMFNSHRGSGYGAGGAGESGGDDDSPVKNEYEYVASSGSSGAGSAAGAKAKLLRQQQLLPMGIQRSEHRDPEVLVATTAELEAADAAAAAAASGAAVLPAAGGDGDDGDDDDSDDTLSSSDEAGVVVGAGAGASQAVLEDDNEVWARAIRTNGSVRLVDVDGQEIEVTDIDTLAKKRQEIAAAAAAASGAVVKQEEDENGVAIGGVPSAVQRPKKKRRHPRQAAAAAAAAAVREQKNKDPEEIAIEEGLQVLLHDLALDAPGVDDPEHAPAAASAAGAAASGDPSRREGRLFLFQFPPVLPALQSFQPDSRSGDQQPHSGAPGSVKREPGEDDDDVVMLDSVRAATADQAIDLTAAGEAAGASAADAAAAAAAGEDGIGGGGFLGTLSVRRSGRTELSWGGMTFAMMPGADVQFLTTAVLLEDADEKQPARHDAASAGRAAGHAFGMGPVGGKYNLVPVFSDETEWVVDPADLEGTGGGS